MLDNALDQRSRSAMHDTMRHGWEWQRFALVATCGGVASVIAEIIATVSAEGANPAIAVSLLLDLGIVAAAFVLAAAVLRMVDAIMLHRQVRDMAAQGEPVGDETRRLLEARHPGTAARAAALDAATLLDRALHPRNDPSARS